MGSIGKIMLKKDIKNIQKQLDNLYKDYDATENKHNDKILLKNEKIKNYYALNPDNVEYNRKKSKEKWTEPEYRNKSLNSKKKWSESLTEEDRAKMGKKAKITFSKRDKDSIQKQYKKTAKSNIQINEDKAIKKFGKKNISKWMVKRAKVIIKGRTNYFNSKQEVLEKYKDQFTKILPRCNTNRMTKVFEWGQFKIAKSIKGARGKNEFYNALPGWKFQDHYVWEGNYAVDNKLFVNEVFEKICKEGKIKVSGKTYAKK